MQSHVTYQNPIICPARTLDDRDVMIRLVCIKDDPSPSGTRHLDILHRIAKGHVACIGNNHIVPVLQELTNDEHGLTFIVQPKLFDIDEFPTWYTAREAADFVVQMLEVSAGLPSQISSQPYSYSGYPAAGSRLLPQASHCSSRRLFTRFRRVVHRPLIPPLRI